MKSAEQMSIIFFDANGNLANIKRYQNGKIKLNIYVLTNAHGDVVCLYYLGKRYDNLKNTDVQRDEIRYTSVFSV